MPDLRAQGLQFVQAQRLQFDGGWACVLIGALSLKQLQALRRQLPAALV